MGAESNDKTPDVLNDPALNHQIQENPSLLTEAWHALVNDDPQTAAELRTIANIISHEDPVRKQGILDGLAYHILKNRRAEAAVELDKILEDNNGSS